MAGETIVINNGHWRNPLFMTMQYGMPQAVDITGHRYGKLTAISPAGSQNGRRRWRCRCDCGTEGVYSLSGMRSGNTQSCGCYHKQRASEGNLVHGHGRQGQLRTAEYRIWKNMKSRCTNSRIPAYARYGARGIRICDRWMSSFENFFADMGPRPSPRHSIDRIDNDGHYEPGNCRWATPTTQRRNQPRCKMTAEIAKDIRLRRASGESWDSISAAVGLSKSYVREIALGRYWSDA